MLQDIGFPWDLGVQAGAVGVGLVAGGADPVAAGVKSAESFGVFAKDSPSFSGSRAA